MKSLKLFPFLFLLAACTGGTPKYDATGTFEATEVIVSAEASGKLLSFDIEEGTTLKDGQEVGIIDTVQLYLKKLQLEASVKSVEGQRPDILKQVAATQEQIVQARRERDRVSNLLRVGAANQKQLDDAESLLEVLRKQLDAQNSTLRNSDRSLTWQSSSVGIQVAQIEDQLRKCHIIFATVFHTTIEENYDLVRDIYRQIEPFRKRRAGALSGGMKQKGILGNASPTEGAGYHHHCFHPHHRRSAPMRPHRLHQRRRDKRHRYPRPYPDTLCGHPLPSGLAARTGGKPRKQGD